MTHPSPLKKPTAGVFIDGANLYYAQKQNRWKLDYNRLKDLISRETDLKLYRYYQAIPRKTDPAYIRTTTYMKRLKTYCTIKTKPLKYIRTATGIVKKGDVDLEIALDVVRRLPELDLIIIITGDSDYLELRRFVLENHKHILFMGYKQNFAWVLKQGKYLLFDALRDYLEYKKTPRRKPRRILAPLLYHKTSRPTSNHKSTNAKTATHNR